MSNTPRKGIVRQLGSMIVLAALVGMALGCGASSPAAPTPRSVTPPPAAPSAVYAVTASTTSVAAGAQLSVSWTTSAGGHNDYIALFKEGDPNTAHSWWTGWTDGVTSGTFTLSAPSQAGRYEFRYLLDVGYMDAAVSSLVTVGKGP